MIRIFINTYLTWRFFLLFGILVGLFGYAFVFPPLLAVTQILLALAIALVLVDGVFLYHRSTRVVCERPLPETLSLSDANRMAVRLENTSRIALELEVIDELPDQLQTRDFSIKLQMAPGAHQDLSYTVRPLVRGEYTFGRVRVLLRTRFGLLRRRITYPVAGTVAVYPSYIQMKHFELHAFSRISHHSGIKKIRRLGHSYEFEQIKNYVRGDDYRSINWKATGRRMDLMVNQYEDEKAQQIYSVVDKSRSMHMPFNGLSLLDHAINTSLVISNIALLKYDKAGLLTFSNKLGTTIKADRTKGQLRKIMQALYNEQAHSIEANFELLYTAIRHVVKGRSLLFLYTNFESYYAMERVLPILRKINRTHLLVAVFFENTELVEYGQRTARNTKDIYNQTMARKFVAEKRRIAEELNNRGIQTILTAPEALNVNTINKYLELKSKGLI